MVRSLQVNRAAHRRDRARERRRRQSGQSEYRRESESLLQIQHPRDSYPPDLQERASARSGHWHDEQEGFSRPDRSAVVKFRAAKFYGERWGAQTFYFSLMTIHFSPLKKCARRGLNAQPSAPEADALS